MGGGGRERQTARVHDVEEACICVRADKRLLFACGFVELPSSKFEVIIFVPQSERGGGMFGGGCEFMTSNVRSVMKTGRDGPFNVETDQQTLATERKIIHCSANPPPSQNWLVLPLRLV